MENNDLSIVEKRLVARFLDMFIKFGLILALGSFCFTVFMYRTLSVESL